MQKQKHFFSLEEDLSMKNPLKIFAIRRDERWMALMSMLIFTCMNAMLIYNHFAKFTLAKYGKIGAWSLFNNQLHFSGYDPYAYMTLTKYTVYYTLDRHPLYTALLYPFYLLNHFIMTTWNFNACMFIMAVLVVLASVYSVLFMYRTLREVIGLCRSDSVWLTSFLFSFASIMTSAMSPDHFIFSLFMLTLTLYVFGKAMVNGVGVAWWKAALLYLFTTGITLTNGAKTLLGFLFVEGKQTFRLKNVFLVLVLPSAILAGVYAFDYKELVVTRQAEAAHIMEKRIAKDPTIAAKDSITKLKNQQITGKPISDKPFLKWIDMDSSRPNGIIEGLFGESVQLHKDYLLGDIYLGRPAVVHYRSFWNYIVEGLVILLLIGGIVVGYRSRVVQMLLSWFCIDLFIHVVLGFGINEVYINGTHWMFLIPVAVGCLYRRAVPRLLMALRWTVCLLTVYLWCYNGSLIISYLLHA